MFGSIEWSHFFYNWGMFTLMIVSRVFDISYFYIGVFKFRCCKLESVLREILRMRTNKIFEFAHESGSPAALNNLQFHWTLVSRSSIVFRARVHCSVVWCIVFSANQRRPCKSCDITSHSTRIQPQATHSAGDEPDFC